MHIDLKKLLLEVALVAKVLSELLDALKTQEPGGTTP